MLLTVIVPDKQPGMERMLKKELAGIDAEVINKQWHEGIRLAQGDFICLLERNSAVSPGAIKNNLREFVENPKYRKLAMVSPRVDLPSQPKPLSWSYWRKKGKFGGLVGFTQPPSDTFHTTRIGQAYGAIIRKSSLLKANIPLNFHPHAFSVALSLFFWENGLRIALQPESLYYAPENALYTKRLKPRNLPTPSAKVWQLWEREMIS